jgi:hypothetical protein
MSDRVISGDNATPDVEQPIFDVSRLSWRDTKLGYRAQVMINKAHTESDVAMMDDALAGMEHLLARATVSVLRSWLVDDAPAEIDWRDPKSFDWLQGQKFSDLITAMNVESSPQAASKNSVQR